MTFGETTGRAIDAEIERQVKIVADDRDRVILDLQNRLVDALEEIEQLRNPAPEPQDLLLIGAAWNNNTSGTDGVQEAAQIPYDAVRIYAKDSSVAERDKMVALIEEHGAAGVKHVVVSFKPPRSWSDMAAGLADPWIRATAKAVSDAAVAAGVTVWLIISHEPENDTGTNNGKSDAGQAAWKAFQSHAGQLIKGKYPSTLFGPCLMGYHSQPKVSSSKWWLLERCIPVMDVDFVFFDPYEDSTNVPAIAKLLGDFCKANGLISGFAEYGIKKGDYSGDPTQMDKTVAACRINGLRLLAYFNTQATNTNNPDPATSYAMEQGGPRFKNWVAILKAKKTLTITH